ncbi:MAG: LysR family transcriptional regulator [Beijerinckiaceae bacterium]|nr:LysR family transcriptional regulator [Beijerinckiaceae bacterium]
MADIADPTGPARAATPAGGPELPLSWNDLRAFLAVSVHGSMNRAAAALGESQPTVGRRMRRLEEATGLTLLLRSANRTDLTEAGEALLQAIGPMGEAASRLPGLLRQHRALEKAPIRITATTSLALFLSENVTQLRAAAPAREIVLMPTRQRIDLRHGEAEIALRMNAVAPEPGLLARKVATLSFALYGLRGAGSLPVIMPSGHGTMSRQLALAQRALVGRSQGPLIDELHLRYQAVRAGVGIGSLPCWLGDADPQLEQYCALPQPFLHEDVYLVRTERTRSDGDIEAVIRALTKVFRANRRRLDARQAVTPPEPLPASSAPR